MQSKAPLYFIWPPPLSCNRVLVVSIGNVMTSASIDAKPPYNRPFKTDEFSMVKCFGGVGEARKRNETERNGESRARIGKAKTKKDLQCKESISNLQTCELVFTYFFVVVGCCFVLSLVGGGTITVVSVVTCDCKEHDCVDCECDCDWDCDFDCESVWEWDCDSVYSPMHSLLAMNIREAIVFNIPYAHMPKSKPL